MSTFYIKQNDTSPSLQRTLLDAAGAAVDITGGSVQFHMSAKGSGSAKVDAAATIVTAASGIVKYDWVAADTDTAGTYDAEFEVTYGDGTIETFPNTEYMRIVIKEDLA